MPYAYLPLVLILCSALQDAPTSVANLGLDPLAMTVRDGSVYFSADEEDLATDLNGDGDSDDRVAQLYFPETGELRNLGVALAGGGPETRNGDSIGIPVSESAQQVDLNGDGDMLDSVVHLYSIAAGTLTNTGLATFGSFSPSFSDGLLLISAAESALPGEDYNGDGDILDEALFVLDPASGEVFETGMACGISSGYGFMGAADGFVVFPVKEADQGATDLNGDGDTSDSILHVLDTTNGTVSSLGLAERSIYSDGEQIVACASEPFSSVDLNGDGDLFDTVLHLFDPVTQSLIPTLAEVDTNLPIIQSGPVVAYLVRETSVGVDLNGDGDVQATDRILHVLDTDSGLLTLFPLALEDFELAHPFAVLLLDEKAHRADANGDGDIQDAVVHLLDLRDNSILNLGYACAGLGLDRPPWLVTSLDSSMLYFAVDEQAQAGTDLNGDGDGFDEVAFAYQLLSAEVTNLGIASGSAAVAPFVVRDGRAVFTLVERFQGVDANGDGDRNDSVFHLYDNCTGSLENLGLAMGLLGPVLDGDILAMSVGEQAQGGLDLNQDGDATDQNILFVAYSPPAGDTVVELGPGTAGSGGDVPTLTTLGCQHPGGSFAFRIDEALGGAPGVLVVGINQVNLAVLGGTLYPFPFDVFLLYSHSGASGVAGAGYQLVSPGLIDASLAGQTFIAQAAVLDPSAMGGLALSNGLAVTIATP